MIGSASAPASSGNIGPGFNMLALALQLRCTATAEPASRMTLTERNRTSRLNPDDMIHRAVAAAVDQPMHVTINNEVPRSRGLGSSSAVTASVAAAAFKVVGIADARQRVFEIVTEMRVMPTTPRRPCLAGLSQRHLRASSVSIFTHHSTLWLGSPTSTSAHRMRGRLCRPNCRGMLL